MIQSSQGFSETPLMKAERMAAHWLHSGNMASECGNLVKAEKFYLRAQKWHDKMNDLLGNGEAGCRNREGKKSV